LVEALESFDGPWTERPAPTTIPQLTQRELLTALTVAPTRPNLIRVLPDLLPSMG
jgi:hypothetical protein